MTIRSLPQLFDSAELPDLGDVRRAERALLRNVKFKFERQIIFSEYSGKFLCKMSFRYLNKGFQP